MDIKLGSVAYNPKKLERQRWKSQSSTSADYSFRLCGLSYYEQGSDELTLVTKYRCRAFQIEEMRAELGKFFIPGGREDSEGARPLEFVV